MFVVLLGNFFCIYTKENFLFSWSLKSILSMKKDMISFAGRGGEANMALTLILFFTISCLLSLQMLRTKFCKDWPSSSREDANGRRTTTDANPTKQL